MGLGFSIFLIAVGAILAFAVHATVAGLDIHVVGWILMAAGVLGLLVSMIVFMPRRRRTVVETSASPASGAVLGSTVTPEGMVRRETRDDAV